MGFTHHITKAMSGLGGKLPGMEKR